MRKYSIIIPVFNRPQEIEELLESLTRQSYANFEVLVIDDGSSMTCEAVVNRFRDHLHLQYYYKENSGQGFTRNYGYKKASGDYFIVFDSDCIIPENYLEIVDEHLNKHYLDAYGGPDRAHPDFTYVQKAINYSMTSFLTTGGIRGSKKCVGAFHPRSFNMGISREVFRKTGGFKITRMGEDIEFSIRIIRNGFKVGLIEEAFVYHKRRTNFVQFFKQLHFFGRSRVNIRRFFQDEVKWIHLLPIFFVTGFLLYLLSPFISLKLFVILTWVLVFYFLLIFIDATIKHQNVIIGGLSVIASFIQLFAYGIGFIKELSMKARQGRHNPGDGRRGSSRPP
jgi:glycosyltransferase involved in cell wall biosynthesis